VLQQPGEWNQQGQSRVFIEVQEGWMDIRMDPLNQHVSERLVNLAYPLHTGRIDSLIYRLVLTLVRRADRNAERVRVRQLYAALGWPRLIRPCVPALARRTVPAPRSETAGPAGVGLMLCRSVSSQPRRAASATGAAMTSRICPVRCSKSASSNPSVSRSAFIMNSRASACGCETCSTVTAAGAGDDHVGARIAGLCTTHVMPDEPGCVSLPCAPAPMPM
jgi:hypothetical protein